MRLAKTLARLCSPFRPECELYVGKDDASLGTSASQLKLEALRWPFHFFARMTTPLSLSPDMEAVPK